MKELYGALTALALLPLLGLTSVSADAWSIEQHFDGSSTGASCGWGSGGGSRISTLESYSGSQSCQLSVSRGSTAFGTWGGIVDLPSRLPRGGEIWVRLRTFMPIGFNYDSTGEGGHLKFLRIHTMSDSVSNFGYDDIYINPKGSSASEPFKFIYEGEQVWSPIGTRASDGIRLGVWETYEFYVKLDTQAASKGGQAIVRFWKDGRLLKEIRDRQTLEAANGYSDRVHFFTYWNGGAPATQSMYVDDVVITNETPAARDAAGNPFVGMGTEPSTRPNSPVSLVVQ